MKTLAMFHFYLKILHSSPLFYIYTEHLNIHIIFICIQLHFCRMFSLINAFDLLGSLFYKELLLKKILSRKLSFCEQKMSFNNYRIQAVIA
jgi:hypothetical protein